MIQEQMQQAGTIATLATYSVEVLALGGLTWGAMKGFTIQLDSTMEAGKKRKRIKFWTAQLFGPLAAVAAHAMGFLVSPEAGFGGYVGAALFGYMATRSAVGAHHGIEAIQDASKAKKSRLPQ